MGKKLIIPNADFSENCIVIDVSYDNNYNLPEGWYTYSGPSIPLPRKSDGTGTDRFHIFIPIKNNAGNLATSLSIPGYVMSVNSWASTSPSINDSGWLESPAYNHSYSGQGELSVHINFKKSNSSAFTSEDVISILKHISIIMETGGETKMYIDGES